jgi:branched-chain amino acid aminotransferase
MTAPLAYMSGHFVPAEQALLPVTDAGFVQGITVSEQLRTFRGKLFELDAHWQRLARSLEITGITPAEPLYEISYAAEQIAKHNQALLDPGDDLGIVVAITPGTFGSFQRLPQAGPQTIVHSYPLPFARWANQYRTGISLRIAPQIQVNEKSWPRELKCRSRMHYYLADQWAHAQELGSRALLLDEAGLVNETSSANIVAVIRSQLISPPLHTILPGISLKYLARLASQQGWVFTERELTVAELLSADEVLVTSTPYAVLPVTKIDGHAIGTGKPGSVFGEMLNAWSNAVGVDLAAQALRNSM